MKSTTPAAMKVVFATGMLLVAANSLPAATRTWTGDGGNDLWSNPNNWSPAGVPQDGDDLNFFLQVCPYPNPCVPITVVNDLNNLRAGRLRFGDPYVGNGAYLKEYIVNGNPLRLTGRVTVGCYCGDDSPLVKVTFNCPLVLESDPRFDVAYGGWDTIGWQGRENRLLLNGAVNLNGHDLDILLGQNLSDSRSRVDISGTISGAGNIYIHAGRSCTAEFNGAADNTFTGTLTFDGGAADHRFVLNKTSGAVTHGRLVIDGYCYWNRPEQLGNEATVQINDYSRARLQGHNETILNLEMAPGAAANSGAFLDTEGGALVVLNRITSQSGFDPPAIAGRLDLAQDLICDVNGTNFYGLDLQAVVSGAGALVKAGNAALRLSGNNTFTGSVRVGQGTVEAAHTGAFGRAADRVLLVAGTVRLNNVVIPDEILVVQQDGGTLFTLGAAGWTGPIRLTQPGVDLTVYGENFTVSGDITGTGGLVLLGNSITFAGDYDNTFSGATRVGCERLQLNKPPGVRAVSGPLIIGADVPEQHEVRWLNHGQLPPDANVTLHQSGLLSLNDFAETLANLTFNGGHVNLASDSVLQLFGTVTANPSSATALIDGATGLGSFFLSGMRTFNVADGTVAGPDLRIDARIAGGIGGGGMTKIGDGTLALGGNNNFSGAVIISNGIVRADHNNALGTTSAGTTVHEGATLFLANAADLVREPVILNGAGFGGTNGALLASGAVTLSNNVVLAGPSTIRVDSPWQLKIDGVISGAGPLTKIGSGTLTLAGTANNTFSGDTLVNAGTLQLDKSDFVQAVPGNLVIGSGGFFATPATVRHFSQDQIWAGVTVNAGSLLDVNGYEEYLLTLTLNGGGDVQTGGGLLTLLAGNSLGVDPGPTGNNTATISGRLGLRVGNHQISVGGFNLPPPGGAPELDIPATVEFVDGLANLHKHGAGTMRLRGANTFTGTLIVNDGRVIAAHNSALGTTQATRPRRRHHDR
jgi:autotransporter-associated beta strand protein